VDIAAWTVENVNAVDDLVQSQHEDPKPVSMRQGHKADISNTATDSNIVLIKLNSDDFSRF